MFVNLLLELLKCYMYICQVSKFISPLSTNQMCGHIHTQIIYLFILHIF